MTNNNQETGQSDAIKVIVRVRPPESYEGGDIRNQLCMSVSQDKKSVIMQCKPQPKVFTYDFVADGAATQEEVFNSVGRNIVESCISGYNGTIFAYGQTGSGKTFTMLGPSEEGENLNNVLRGIIPRCFEHLFNMVLREQELHGTGKEFLLKCTFLEIYQERIYDLLEPSSQNLQLRENMKKGVFVDGIVEHSVTNSLEAYQVLQMGWINRRVASTSMNRESSRSHAVFAIQIESREMKGGVQNIKSSQLTLVDLAGSERQKDTQTTGKRLKEGCSINASLSILGMVIMSLVDISNGKKRYVPYRDSRLTFLLKDALGGNAKTRIIACVHPGAICFGETLSTLDFAKRAKMIKNKVVINEDVKGDVASLQAEVKHLKEMLSQLQAGHIPKDIGGGDMSNMKLSVMSEWREKFLHAMLFLEKAVNEKSGLMEKIESLNTISQKKDKFIQSQKMIVKFRDSSIARMEKTSLSNDEKLQGRLEDMKGEISALKEMIEHHPQVKKYASDVQHLKSENKHLQNQLEATSACLLHESKLEKLENMYRETLAADSGTKTPQQITPSGTPNISVATMERYKAEVEKYQQQISDLKKELTDNTESSEKKETKLQSEIESLKKMNKELQMVLETNQLKSKIEREALQDKHLQTVKAITTPKKIKYKLRNRTVTSNSSDVFSSPALDNSLLMEEEDLIMNEMEPAEMREQAQEALMTEIKELQEKNNLLSNKVAEMEKENIMLRELMSQIDLEKGYLDEKLKKEQQEKRVFEEKSTKEVERLTSEVEKLEKDMKLVKEERDDNILLLTAAYRQVDNITKEKDIGEQEMENKLIELEKLEQECEEVKRERDVFQSKAENLEQTNSYQEDLIKDLNEEIAKHAKELKEVQTQKQKLEHELEQSKKVIEEGEEKERVIPELIGLKCELERQLEESQNDCLEMKRKLESAELRNTAQQKMMEEKEEVIASYLTKMETLKSSVQICEEKKESLSQEKDALSSELSWKTTELERLTDENTKLQGQLSDNEIKHNIEVSILREELDDTMNNLEKTLKNQDNERSQLQTQLSQKETELTETMAELQSTKLELETLKSSHTAEIARLKGLSDTTGSQAEELAQQLQEKEEENNLLNSKQQLLAEKIEEYEKLWMSKNTEIEELKSKISEMEGLEENLKLTEEKYRCTESEVTQLKERNELLESSFSLRMRELESKSATLHRMELEQSQLQSSLQEAQREKMAAETNLSSITDEAERLRDIIRGYQAEKEEREIKNAELLKELADQEEKLSKLQEENTNLASHQNPKQKIHYTCMLKHEINSLQEKIREKNSTIEELRKQTGVLQPRAVIDWNRSEVNDIEENLTPARKKCKH